MTTTVIYRILLSNKIKLMCFDEEGGPCMADVYLAQAAYARMLDKTKQLRDRYQPYLYRSLRNLDCVWCPTGNHLTSPDQVPSWQPIKYGDVWADKEFQYAWFQADLTIDETLVGKRLWLLNQSQSAEALAFINGSPCGMFDVCDDMLDIPKRQHRFLLLTSCAQLGETISIALEGYGGNDCVGVGPYETVDGGNYPISRIRQFRGLEIVEIDELVENFLRDLNIVGQLYDQLPEEQYRRWEAAHALEEVFCILPQKPDQYVWAEIRQKLARAESVLDTVLKKHCSQSEPIVGLIGHSHLDTAWLWPVEETKRKAARTFSNAVQLMERYTTYTFQQRSGLYLQWIKQDYPAILEKIKIYTNKGQWEPNGGSWIEPDCNMISGELMIRHFLRGQLFLERELGYHADCFWLPDTFGYSAAIPQIMRGFGMKYFLTTKLSWNDTTSFPYDSFVWRGLDGSEVLVHFNLTHRWPDVANICQAVRGIHPKRNCNRKLLSYGFGDGGGGPHYGMVEMAERTADLEGLPLCEKTTVSNFMQKLEKENPHLPVYSGELYLELHRGTLTQFHDIKRTNRKAEIALREWEYLSSAAEIFFGVNYPSNVWDRYDRLLINQFHDILPGTSISRVMQTAIEQNTQLIAQVDDDIDHLVSRISQLGTGLLLENSLPFTRREQFALKDTGVYPVGIPVQRIETVWGEKKITIRTELPSMSAKVLPTGPIEEGASPFRYDGTALETPFAHVVFNENGYIASLYDKQAHRELHRKGGLALGTFVAGEDVPAYWDNWDIDGDQRLKMQEQLSLLSSEVVGDGCLQFRIRNRYVVGRQSTLTQDVVFHSDSSQIDFETVVDWKETHTLLKTVFDLNIQTTHVKTETQFGYLERACYSNSESELAKFEVCNHKWTDLSEARFGVALLNDCKYGISVYGSCMALTLHKSGAHPTPEGDCGCHIFTYALRPHNEGFSAPAVIYPAYELNIPVRSQIGQSAEWQFAQIDSPNIILETVKKAEDGNGYILRLYECEQSGCETVLRLGFAVCGVFEVDMMERTLKEIATDGKTIPLSFHSFEIKTLRILVPTEQVKKAQNVRLSMM